MLYTLFCVELIILELAKTKIISSTQQGIRHLHLHIVDVNAVYPVLCRTYYFRTCNCRPNNKRKCRPKSVELMYGSQASGHFTKALPVP